MRIAVSRVLIVTMAGLWLAGCSSTGPFTNPFAKTPGSDAQASAPPEPDNEPTGSIGGSAINDLEEGKHHYREKNYVLAEKHFRRAAERRPRDVEAWLGLAASYDRMNSFDMADRAYRQATAIVGVTPEILNNEGYSYMLRGDFKRARAKLEEARRKDPGNKFVRNNLQMLEDKSRKGKAIQ